ATPARPARTPRPAPAPCRAPLPAARADRACLPPWPDGSDGPAGPLVTRPTGRSATSGVDTLGVVVLGAVDDEVLPRRDVVAHEELEHPLGLDDRRLVRHRDTPERAPLRIHGRLGELVGVHLTQALVPLDRLLVPASLTLELCEQIRQLRLGIGVDDLTLLAARAHDLHAVQRWYGGEDPARLHQRTHVTEEQGEQQGP